MLQRMLVPLGFALSPSLCTAASRQPGSNGPSPPPCAGDIRRAPFPTTPAPATASCGLPWPPTPSWKGSLLHEVSGCRMHTQGLVAGGTVLGATGTGHQGALWWEQ